MYVCMYAPSLSQLLSEVLGCLQLHVGQLKMSLILLTPSSPHFAITNSDLFLLAAYPPQAHSMNPMKFEIVTEIIIMTMPLLQII